MSDIKSLVERLRDTVEEETGHTLRNEAADMIEQQAARIAELEAANTANDAEPVCYAVSIEVASAMAKERTMLDTCTKQGGAYDTPLYVAAPVADSAMAKDAERLDILEVELRVERAKVERCVQILSAIHGLLNPQDVKLDDGRIMRFSKPEFQIECYRQLSERIREIPESLDAAIAASAEKGDKA